MRGVDFGGSAILLFKMLVFLSRLKTLKLRENMVRALFGMFKNAIFALAA